MSSKISICFILCKLNTNSHAHSLSPSLIVWLCHLFYYWFAPWLFVTALFTSCLFIHDFLLFSHTLSFSGMTRAFNDEYDFLSISLSIGTVILLKSFATHFFASHFISMENSVLNAWTGSEGRAFQCVMLVLIGSNQEFLCATSSIKLPIAVQSIVDEFHYFGHS